MKLVDLIVSLVDNHWKTIDEINSMSNEGSKEGLHVRYGNAVAALEKATMRVILMQKEIAATATRSMMQETSAEVDSMMRDLDLTCPFCNTIGCTSDHK